tara:strand:+ start:40 stop:198 length:159 start_codon:yes stop_codon:yes gene_type:complete
MIVGRRHSDGALIVSDIVDGYLRTNTFIGFTEKEAKESFKLNYKPNDKRRSK